MTSKEDEVARGTWPQQSDTVIYLNSDPERRAQTASALDSELSAHTVETASEPAVVLERIESDDVGVWSAILTPSSGTSWTFSNRSEK